MRLNYVLLFIACLKSSLIFSQSVHYFGWDTSLAHTPSDIIQTQDGGFLLIGDVNSSTGLFENYISQVFLVRTDSIGDTLWTRYYFHDAFGNENLLETNTGEFKTLGSTNGGYICDMIGTTVPFTDYCVQSYSSQGDSLYTFQYSDNCEDGIMDFCLNPAGGISALLMEEDLNANRFYCIKTINMGGALFTVFLPNNYVSDLEATTNGFWVAGYNQLTKVSASGTFWWQQTMNLPSGITDFMCVNNDSLIFLSSDPYAQQLPDTTQITKTDSAGNVAWVKTFAIKASDVMLHSSGNYLITGHRGDSISVLLISPNGDSLRSRTSSTTLPGHGIKSIEATGNRIATLGYSGGFGMPTQYVLILDSIDPHVGMPDDQLELSFSVYPNPANKEFSIRPTHNIQLPYTVELVNSQGSLADVVSMHDASPISVRELPQGIYFYLVRKKETIIGRGKIMISR